VAGAIDDFVLAGPTAAAFGRTSKDRDVLYVSTRGGIVDPATGFDDGKVVAIDTSKL
jgi:hypothetical protein